MSGLTPVSSCFAIGVVAPKSTAEANAAVCARGEPRCFTRP
jgi:hypothetical protein